VAQGLTTPVQGGQLVDAFGKCLSYSGLDNFEGTSTRIQWLECMTVAEAEADPVTFAQQLWFGEIAFTSTSKLFLRNACTDLVIGRVDGPPSHNPLYSTQPNECGCKYQNHYDVDLRAINLCVNEYQFNECLFDKEVVLP